MSGAYVIIAYLMTNTLIYLKLNMRYDKNEKKKNNNNFHPQWK